MDRIETREDTDNRFPWNRIETTFTMVGDQEVVTSTRTVFDSGVARIDEVQVEDSPFISGDQPPPLPQAVFRYRTWEDGDLNGGDDLQPWTRVVDRTSTPGDSLLTENGLVINPGGPTVTFRTVTYDNGNDTFFLFLAGALSFKAIYDGAAVDNLQPPGVGQGTKPWFAINQTFESSGELQRKEVYFDNGIVQKDFFSVQTGKLIGRELTDAEFADGDGIKPWSSILTDFDEAGRLTSRQTFFDAPITIQETYTDGVLSQKILVQAAPAPSQCSFGSDPNCPEPAPVGVVRRVTDFDAAGERTQQITTYSDNDVTGFIFVDGEITERQFYDGDGDEDWVVARVLFENGQRTDTIIYESLDDVVPDDIIFISDGSFGLILPETFV